MAEPPRRCNAAAWFVDRHVAVARGDSTALVAVGLARRYRTVFENVNRTGHALRRLGVGMGDRVLLLLPDVPEFAYCFWGAIKLGAVPIPTNTLLTPRDYEYILRDSRAVAAIVSASLLPAIAEVRPRLGFLRHVAVVGEAARDTLAFADLIRPEPTELAPAPTTRDDPAFWLYTSGTTGTPKAAVHLQHDMRVCCEGFARHVLEIVPEDRCFSVAKLFFAYGLGNALYFPFAVGAAGILHSGRPEPAKVLELITRERPTLFFAVPTAYAALLQVPDAERRYDLRSIRVCVSAGEPLPKALYERWLAKFGLEILDGIGSTELCHTFIANRRGRGRPGSSGTLVPGHDAPVVGDHGRPGAGAAGVREATPRALQVPALDRVPPRAPQDCHRKDPALQAARPRGAAVSPRCRSGRAVASPSSPRRPPSSRSRSRRPPSRPRGARSPSASRRRTAGAPRRRSSARSRR